MHKIALTLFFASILFASCGGTKESEIQEESSRPIYDATKIDPNAPVVELTILAQGKDMSEMSFDMKSMKVSAGTTVKLIVKSTSLDASMPHNWVLVHKGTMKAVGTAGMQAGRDKDFVPDSPDVLLKSKLLGPNESDTLIFPAPPVGTYEYVCTYPGHWSIMNGTFTVE
ncbi:MAG: plastocyanin/azurin family copper-binding protein [Bacteroidota bacterium]